jgi:hypothetical protein
MGFGSPQPFVPLYAVVLGKGGHVFMNIICIFALWLVSYYLFVCVDISQLTLLFRTPQLPSSLHLALSLPSPVMVCSPLRAGFPV